MLQSAAHLIRVRADAVEVSDSAQLEAALVNPGTTEILLFPSSRVNEVREDAPGVALPLRDMLLGPTAWFFLN